jgi:hypothetical protein
LAERIVVSRPHLGCLAQSELLVRCQGERDHDPRRSARFLGVRETPRPLVDSRSSANFYYLHRGVWVLIMAQLSESLAERPLICSIGCLFREELSAPVCAILTCSQGRHHNCAHLSTGGVLLGLCLRDGRLVRLSPSQQLTSRYIGSGSGRGNPYGLAAIPGAVLTAVFGPVTFVLVLGYVSLQCGLCSITSRTSMQRLAP